MYINTTQLTSAPSLSVINRFYAIDAYMHHTTFSLWCNFRWDFGSAPAERVGQGEVGGFQH